MAETHVLSALKEKRARLMGELKTAELRVAALKADLTSVGHCLRIFGSDVEPEDIAAKVTLGKNSANLPKGAGTRLALTILRETGQALTTQELAACILQRYGRPLEALSLKRLTSTIQANFCRRPDKIVEFDRSTYPGKWRLANHTKSDL
jgi:hypothetical protein